MLGLEREIAVRVHMCSKALASTGAVILCNKTVRTALVQFGKCLTYSGAPSVPMVASIRVGYRFLSSRETAKVCLHHWHQLSEIVTNKIFVQEQAQIQSNIEYFFQTMLEHPDWEQSLDEGLLSVPLAEEWEDRAVHSHVIPIKVRPGHEKSLFIHLLMANINAYPISCM